MAKVNENIFDVLKSVAQEVTNKEKMAAAIVKNGRIVSTGYNSKKTHPIQEKFKKNEHAIYLHAEIDAIIKALRTLKVTDLQYCDIYIVRIKKKKCFDKEFVWGLSKPCEGCLKAILQFGIKRIIYTNDENEYEVVNI